MVTRIVLLRKLALAAWVHSCDLGACLFLVASFPARILALSYATQTLHSWRGRPTR
jgi:hypothetical protein